MVVCSCHVPVTLGNEHSVTRKQFCRNETARYRRYFRFSLPTSCIRDAHGYPDIRI